VAAVVSVLVAQLFRLSEAYWGTDYDLGDNAVTDGCGTHCFLARFVRTALGALVRAIVTSYFGPHLLVLALLTSSPRLLCSNLSTLVDAHLASVFCLDVRFDVSTSGSVLA
jgi:hypothetical protein